MTTNKKLKELVCPSAEGQIQCKLNNNLRSEFNAFDFQSLTDLDNLIRQNSKWPV